MPKLPRPPRGTPKEKVTTGVRQSMKRYRPVVCTNRRVLVYDTKRTQHPRQLLAAFPAGEVHAVDVLPGKWGGQVIVLALPGIGDIPFELGTKDLPDLATMLANLGRGA